MLSVRNLSLSRGEHVLLDSVNFEVRERERLCLLGRNGVGKSTLLGILAARVQADDGEVVRTPGLKIAELVQTMTVDDAGSVGELLESHADHGEDWQREQRVQRIASRLALDPSSRLDTLSGGTRRRALLAAALVAEPDLLLLDEPTNHLDLGTIEWLEGLMRAWRGSIVFVTHDRRLIANVATRILELDRGRLSSWPGDYDNYLRRREERAAAERTREALEDRRLAEEERWIRQGIKARRTRNEGRVRRLLEMRAARARRRQQPASARMQLARADASGRQVIVAEHVEFGYGEHSVVKDLNVRIQRGDRVGLIGDNGSGKTTVLSLLLGHLSPRHGHIERGTRLQVGYFDQYRGAIDDARSVADNVADGNEHLSIDGRSRHVISYLRDFLFTPERARSPAAALSGGERARLVLAKLFARPCNMLVMDEPTNDLDVETLELLEERLLEFDGTLLLVSHDRAFLDNVVTQVLVMEGDGKVVEHVGGYSDWEAFAGTRDADATTRTRAATAPSSAMRAERPQRTKLGYKQQRELELLPARIESLENTIDELQQRLGDPALYRERAADVAPMKSELERLESELAEAYARWDELESASG